MQYFVYSQTTNVLTEFVTASAMTGVLTQGQRQAATGHILIFCISQSAFSATMQTNLSHPPRQHTSRAIYSINIKFCRPPEQPAKITKIGRQPMLPVNWNDYSEE